MDPERHRLAFLAAAHASTAEPACSRSSRGSRSVQAFPVRSRSPPVPIRTQPPGPDSSPGGDHPRPRPPRRRCLVAGPHGRGDPGMSVQEGRCRPGRVVARQHPCRFRPARGPNRHETVHHRTAECRQPPVADLPGRLRARLGELAGDSSDHQRGRSGAGRHPAGERLQQRRPGREVFAALAARCSGTHCAGYSAQSPACITWSSPHHLVQQPPRRLNLPPTNYAWQASEGPYDLVHLVLVLPARLLVGRKPAPATDLVVKHWRQASVKSSEC
jgi:hypothetical protein